MTKRDIRKLAIGVAFLVGIYLVVSNSPTTSELSTEGYTQVQTSVAIVGSRGVVILTGGCYQVTGETDAWIADAISKGQEDRVDFRPSIYDVTKDALNSLGVKVLMVKVIDVRNSTFIGRLVMQQGNKIVSLDSRPSDATAIAVRTNAPVYISDAILQQYGQRTC